MRNPRRNWKEFWGNARKNWRLETFHPQVMLNSRFLTVEKFDDSFDVVSNKEKEQNSNKNTPVNVSDYYGIDLVIRDFTDREKLLTSA